MDLTTDDDKMIADAQRTIERKRAALRAEQAKEKALTPATQPVIHAVTTMARQAPPPDPEVVREAMRAAAAAGVAVPTPTVDFACAGLEHCEVRVKMRRGICSSCAVEMPRRARMDQLAALRESLSPGGVYDFCVPGNKTYIKTTMLARAAALKLDDEHRAPALALIDKAAWLRETGGILILGPTGFGKSKILIAIALRLLATAAKSSNAAMVKFVTGIRYVNGIKLARDARAQKLGAVDAAFQAARGATLLLLDEVGFEDGRIDPMLMRDLLRDRYEPPKPVIMASGATIKQLNKRYGAAAIRGIWERGHIIDLHEYKGDVDDEDEGGAA